MNQSTLMIWIGVVLVLLILVSRWRLGVWDIDAEKGPPSPSIWSMVILILGLVLVGWGSILLLRDY